MVVLSTGLTLFWAVVIALSCFMLIFTVFGDDWHMFYGRRRKAVGGWNFQRVKSKFWVFIFCLVPITISISINLEPIYRYLIFIFYNSSPFSDNQNFMSFYDTDFDWFSWEDQFASLYSCSCENGCKTTCSLFSPFP